MQLRKEAWKKKKFKTENKNHKATETIFTKKLKIYPPTYKNGSFL